SPLPKGEGTIRDLSPREIFCLTPLVAMIFWIGLQPGFFLDRMRPTLDDLIAPVTRACETASGVQAVFNSDHSTPTPRGRGG
ncbi:MAG: hypothetical protein KKE86_02090, partial [Planctomycetes bacterium]|nr:hypothetical protein [Planctomycetota bacterium]